MKQIWKDIGFSMVMGILIPGLFLAFGVTVLDRYRMQTIPAEIPPEPSEQSSQPEQTSLPERIFLSVRFRSTEDTVTEMDMDTYLVSVLLAEMPASFGLEALKAQSCVARTYAAKAYASGGKHGDGSICGNPSCCQGYAAVSDYLSAGGTEEDVKKIRTAVYATSGKVLAYDGELIEATYFSCSGGRTEDAVAVWGTDFPYLQAVDSPGEENAAHYTDTVRFSVTEFAEILGIVPTGMPASWLGTAVCTEGGGISTMVIGGKLFTGTQLRSLLGLRSTAFSISCENQEMIITTRGFGHRVGMSQYGADAMAAAGSSWEEILNHYYEGTDIITLS